MTKDLQPISPHIGNRNEEITEKALSTVLRSLFALYIKTLYTHWNYTGTNFASIHAMLDTHYHEQLEAIDTVAERIRAIGYFPTNSSLQHISTHLTGKVSPALSTPATSAHGKMLHDLLLDLQETTETVHAQIRQLQNESNDEASIDVLVELQRLVDKQYWMLRASYTDTE